MSCTIDASVFVAATRSHEAQHGDSLKFVRFVRTRRLGIFCPTLVLPESASAIARPTGDLAEARRLLRFLGQFHGMCFVSLAMPLAERAAEIAVTCRLRGSDSVYVAVAEAFETSLITWDKEMLERTPPLVPTMTPTDWLAQHAPGP